MTSAAAAAADDRPRRRLITQLWFWVLIAIALGIVFGLVAPDQAEKAKWLADAFIQVIQAITGPVIFTTVVIGVASIGSLRKAGGLAGKALVYFFGMTIVALALGLLVGEPRRAGHAASTARPTPPRRPRPRRRSARPGGRRGSSPFITDHVLPSRSWSRSWTTRSCASSCSRIVTAAAISFLAEKERKRVVGVFEVIAGSCSAIIRLVMWAAPLGAFGGMAYTVAQVRRPRR